MINKIKNCAVLLDFVVSIVASAIQSTNEDMSKLLFGISAIILLIAVICVVIELISSKKK